MSRIRKGQRVTFLCSSYLEDGSCLDGESEEPIKMIAGKKSANTISAVFSNSLLGMQRNETKSIKIPAAQAFGERQEDKIYRLPLAQDHKHYEGEDIQITVSSKGGEETLDGVIVKLNGDYASIDTNHPLAGQSLLVKIKVISFL